MAVQRRDGLGRTATFGVMHSRQHRFNYFLPQDEQTGQDAYSGRLYSVTARSPHPLDHFLAPQFAQIIGRAPRAVVRQGGALLFVDARCQLRSGKSARLRSMSPW